MYDKRYYDDRKADLEKDFNESKDKAFAKFIQLAEEWKGDAGKIQEKFRLLTEKEQEAMKQDAEKEKEAKEAKEKK